MANNQILKNAVSAVIKANGNNEITGTILQNVLISIINQFSSGSVFSGFALPDTNPGNPDFNAFYIALTPGIYSNFGAFELQPGKIAVLNNNSGSFTAVQQEFKIPGVNSINPDGSEIPNEKAVAEYVEPIKKETSEVSKKTRAFVSLGENNEYVEIAAFLDGKVYRWVNTKGEHNIILTKTSVVPAEAIKGLGSEIKNLPELSGISQIVKISKEGIYAGYSDGKARRIDLPAEPVEAATALVQGVPDMYNACWSEWVSPLFVEVPEKDILISSPVKRGLPPTTEYNKKMGSVWALNSKFKQQYRAKELMPILYNGVNSQPVQALWTVDDHNAGCTLVDLRTGAAAPITVIQNDHGSPYKPRIAAMDFDSNLIGAITTLGVASLPVTYGQISRNPNNPDQIYYMYREGGSNAATWSIARSMDNGVTWEKKTLFGDGTGSDYLLSREARDMSGIHIVGTMHPISGAIQTVVYLHLDWDGALSDNVNGVHIADVFAEDHTYNMFLANNARLIRTPVGTKRTRLHDFFETEENIIEVVISEFNHSNNYAGSAQGQEYRHLKFNTGETSVISDTYIMSAGWPQEINAGANDYFCGGTVIDVNTLILARWDSKDVVSNNSHIGKGSLFKCVLSDGVWSVETLKTLENQKFSRPKVGVSFRTDKDGIQRMSIGQYFYVMEGYYHNFGDYDLTMKTYKIKEIK